MNFFPRYILVTLLVILLVGCSTRVSETYIFDKIIGKEETPGEFREPIGIAINKEGFIYISDADNHRIQILSPKGRVLAIFGASILKYPTDIAVDQKGNIWVVDFGNDRVVKFKPGKGL